MNKQCLVIDSSATAEAPLRTHEVMVDGKIVQVHFKHGEDTLLPYHVAMKFNKDGFTVKDADGKTINQPPQTNDTVKSRLRADEIIAKYDELEVSALQMRAVIRPGGEKYVNGPVQKSVLIDFLLGADKLVDADEDLIEDDDEEAQTAPPVMPESLMEKAGSVGFTPSASMMGTMAAALTGGPEPFDVNGVDPSPVKTTEFVPENKSETEDKPAE